MDNGRRVFKNRRMILYIFLVLLLLTACAKKAIVSPDEKQDINVNDGGDETSAFAGKNYSTIFVSRQGLIGGEIENSIPGIIAAGQAGYDIVRVDVQFTKDNIPVLFHDETIGKSLRVYDNAGNTVIGDKVASYSYEDLLQWGFGSRDNKLATLEEAVILCKKMGIGLLLEFKDSTVPSRENMEDTYSLISKHGMLPNTIWSVYDLQTACYIKDLDETCDLAYIQEEISEATIDVAAQFYTGKNDVWFCAYASHAEELTEELHVYAAKKHVRFKIGSAYTINDLIRFADFEIIEVANIAHPQEILSLYAQGRTSRYYTPSIDTYDQVVLIGVDGAGAFFQNADTPNFDRIFATGAVTYEMLAPYPTNSSEGWGSMLYGASSIEHGIKNQIIRRRRYFNDNLPSIVRVISNEKPEAEIASIVGWTSINSGLLDISDANVLIPLQEKEESLTNSTVLDNVKQYLSNHNPSFLFVQLDGVDHAGHEYGWGSKEFYDAILEADNAIGQIYDDLCNQGRGNTLFIVASDHGGVLGGNNHGGESKEEQYCMLAIAGRNVLNGAQMVDVEPRDVASIVLCALGIQQPDTYTGRVPTGVWKNVGGDDRPVSVLTIEKNKYSQSESVSVSNWRLADELLSHQVYHNSFDFNPQNYEAEDDFSGYYEKSLDATLQYCPTNVLWEENWTGISFSFWVKAEKGKGDPVIISNKNWNSGLNAGIAIVQRESDILFNLGDGVGHRQDIVFPIPSDYWGKWTHYLFSVDLKNKTVTGYWNFEMMFSEPLSGEMELENIKTKDALVIAQDATKNYKYRLNAKVDDVKIFNCPLSESDVIELSKYYVN